MICLDYQVFLLNTEYGAEHIADFTERGVVFDALQDGGHGVFRAAGNLLEVIQGCLDPVIVPGALDLLKAGKLGFCLLGVDAGRNLDGSALGEAFADGAISAATSRRPGVDEAAQRGVEDAADWPEGGEAKVEKRLRALGYLD